MSLIIKNANLLGSNITDIKINNEKIEAIGNNLDEKDSEIYDAENKLVLPGGIDVHTHMSLDLGEYVAVDDFHTGFRVIIVIEANSYVNIRSSRLLPKFKTQKINSWCAA